MKSGQDKQALIVLGILGGLMVVLLALFIAPAADAGLYGIVMKFSELGAGGKFQIEWCEDSLGTVFFCLLTYLVVIGIFWSDRKNYRRREEHGSAKWGSAPVFLQLCLETVQKTKRPTLCNHPERHLPSGFSAGKLRACQLGICGDAQSGGAGSGKAM